MKKEELNMKVWVKQLFRIVLLCTFLCSSFAIAEAASSKQNSLKFSVNQGDSSEGAKTFSKSAKPIPLEKLRSRTTTPKKLGFSREKYLKKAEKKEAHSCLLASVTTTGCFTNCLSRYVSPDVVAHCANACGSGDLGGCGSCLGLGAFIVAYCALECSGEFIPEDPPQSRNIKHKNPNKDKWTRQNMQTVSR